MLFWSLMIVFNYLVAQTLSPSVISTSGAFYANSTGMLSTTIGEMSMVETFSSGSVILTQGFQQVFDTVTSITEAETTSVAIFPNPANDILYLKLPPGEFNFSIYNSIGQLVLYKTVTVNEEIVDIPVSHLANGLYHLFIRINKDSFHSKFNLMK